MMKAKAKHWVNYNGVWHRMGEVFDIEDKDAEEMKRYAEVSDGKPDVTEAPEEEPAKRARKRRAEE